MWLLLQRKVNLIHHVTLASLLTVVFTAKHLEPLKGGKIPVEILVITKDQEQKKKSFEKCLEVIKNAGVSLATRIPTLGHTIWRYFTLTCPIKREK